MDLKALSRSRTIRLGQRTNLEVKKEGYLNKRGQRLSMIKHRRYFRLDGTHLTNFKDAADTTPSWDYSLLKCSVEPGENKTDLVIRLPNRVLELSAENEADAREWIDKFTKASNMYIENFYEFGEILGKGQFGVVMGATDIETRERVAIKVLKKKHMDEEDYKYLKREIDIVTKVNHPSVVITREVFETEEQIMIVMEYLGGGMLYDIIADRGTLTEQEASYVMLEILEGVEYLHSLGIVHRDLKPENMLCVRRAMWPWRVKLCDFGLANFVEERTSLMQTQVGTPYFAAPEVVKGLQYDSSVDLWSCGVILYTLLSGMFPFDDQENQANIFKLIVKAQVKFPDAQWSDISTEAKDLVFKLLQKDPTKRLSATSAKQHPWIVSGGPKTKSIIRNDMSMVHMSMRNFKEAAKERPELLRPQASELVESESTANVGAL
ncbi:Myosin light chain kinase A [Porphyridium purpureum]|uniref:Myosin light chain kinase A n=1 Tax=Porphyridium purpureum TaxID=35688 RepID=A0A5J4Z7A4_PORPP|nr:Myosin light chain kinase A [Porphyridium purpureum]|eukprot:POR3984..scf295_1